MEHVEALLLLHGADPASRTAEAIAAGAHFATVAAARRCLDELAAAGLLAAVGKDTYHFTPRDVAIRQAVEMLADMYNTKPVTLVRAVYGRPASPVQAFADAFRLRKDED